MPPKPQLLIFDVNETLLNLNPLEEKINSVLDDSQAFKLWFRMLLHYSLVETTSRNYTDFNTIGKATFEMTAKQYGKDLEDDLIENILSTIKELPAHNEVPTALKKLSEQGFKLAALTNGSLKTAQKQLKFAKIDHFFEGIYSVDSVEKYKPHPETYHYVLKQMNCKDASEAMLVAAHGWDITGAQRAGLQSCFVEREDKFIYPLAKKPTFFVQNLDKLIEKLS